MDILDIVNQVVKKNEAKQLKTDIHEIANLINNGQTIEKIAIDNKLNLSQLEEELYRSGYSSLLKAKNVISEKVINEDKSQHSSLSLETIQNLIFKFYKGVSFPKLAEELNVNEEFLYKELVKKNYKKRWILTDSLIVNKKLLQILKELNRNQKNLDDVSKEFFLDMVTLKSFLKETWALETSQSKSKSYCKISNELLIVTSKDDSKLIYIEYKGKKLISSLQVNSLLGINSNYYYNLGKEKFIYGLHFVKLEKNEISTINYSIPYLDYLGSVSIYTKDGIEILAELSKKQSILNSRKYKELFELIEEDKNDTIPLHSTSEESSINNELNENKSLNSLHYSNVNKGEVFNLLDNIHGNTNNFSEFFNEWHPYGEKGILEDIVRELNSGATFYDISLRYSKNKKYRVGFSTKLQKKLEIEGYIFNRKNEKWEKDSEIKKVDYSHEISKQLINSNPDNDIADNDIDDNKVNNDLIPIDDIVSYLNKNDSISQAELEFGISAYNIRILLKNNGFTYNVTLKKWSQKNRIELYQEISEDLKKGNTTFEKLKEEGLNIDNIERQLNELNLGYDLIYKENVSVLTSQNKHEKVIVDNVNEYTNEDVIENNFTFDEIIILKKIIHDWKEIGQDNHKKEKITFFLSKSILNKLETYSESNDLSRSKVLEIALESFLKQIREN